MNKILTIAALALVLSACSNEDNDIQTPVEQPAKSEGIPFTATISIGENAMTRALTEDATNNQIVPTWVAGEKVALIHNGVNDEMSVASVSGGVATITGTITGSPTTGDAVTIIYPSTAADGTTGNVKANLLAAQDGTLATIAANYDVRKGTGTMKVSGTTSLNGNVSLTNLNAIFKFTLQDLSAAAKSATEFKVSDGSGNVITTVTPGSASGELYVALPVMAAGTYWFNATIDSKPYIAKATTAAATVAGKYYQTTVKMATIGDVILADGTFAARLSTTGTKVAMIAYVGSETGVAGYTHGLALALSDEELMNWSTATGASGAAAHTPAAPTPTTSSWMLPSKDQWNKMIDACKNVLGTQNNYLDLRGGFSGITGASNLHSSDYWSSSEYNSSDARYCSFANGGRGHVTKSLSAPRVRACLAF